MKYLITLLYLIFYIASFGQNKNYYFKEIGLKISIPKEFVTKVPEKMLPYSDEEWNKTGVKVKKLLDVSTPSLMNSITINLISDSLNYLFGDSIRSKQMKAVALMQLMETADKVDTSLTSIKIGKFIFQKFIAISHWHASNKISYDINYLTSIEGKYLSISLRFDIAVYGDKLTKAIESAKFN